MKIDDLRLNIARIPSAEALSQAGMWKMVMQVKRFHSDGRLGDQEANNMIHVLESHWDRATDDVNCTRSPSRSTVRDEVRENTTYLKECSDRKTDMY